MSDTITLKAGYSPQAFTITALTNMHAGSGKNSYAVIDNLVQRDVLTGMPTINSSSLKGALREYCSAQWGRKDLRIRHIFGADTKDQEESSQGGAYVFMAAQLLSIPMRSDVRPFLRATSPSLIQDFIAAAQSFGLHLSAEPALNALAKAAQGDAVHFLEGYQGQATIEDLELKAAPGRLSEDIKAATAILGDDLVLVDDQKLSDLVSDLNLPIIARNSLENGISQNLWYEQVLPRQTRFAAFILCPADDKHQASFLKTVQASPVQIGANASIGYGFSTLKTIDHETS